MSTWSSQGDDMLAPKDNEARLGKNGDIAGHIAFGRVAEMVPAVNQRLASPVLS